MIRVFIVDDHKIVREGLKQILSETPDISLVGEASNGPDFLEQMETVRFDILVLDLTMPGRGGLDVLATVKRLRPELPVLVLSMHPEDQYAIRVIRAGASGYLNKEAAATDLVGAIRTVAEGKKFVTASVAEKLATYVSSRDTMAPHEQLSDREFQVLTLIASGKTVTEIANDLSLSVKTVSTYRSRILEKMQLKSNAELTHYVISNKLDG
ncbi:response regulator transcription factor [bacterium]|nr:response regulator transcription factor [bacterium]